MPGSIILRTALAGRVFRKIFAPPSGEIRVMGLGDLLSAALGRIGLTEARVSRWLGGPCGCKGRQEKLNALGAWAMRVLAGKTARAVEHLEDLTDGTHRTPTNTADSTAEHRGRYPRRPEDLTRA